MKKTHKNQLFLFLKENGWNPADFELKTIPTTQYENLKIKYKDSPMEFTTKNLVESYEEFEYRYTTFSPAYKLRHSRLGEVLNFPALLDEFKNWLDGELKLFIDEQNEIDLWEEFKKGNKELNIDKPEFDDRSDFSTEEKIQIKISVNELKIIINNTFNTTPEQKTQVDKRLDYLIDAVDRLNRFDWKSVVISTVINLIMVLTLDVHQGQVLFELFKKVFSTVLQIGVGAG